MAKEARKSKRNKNFIYGICATIIIAIIVVIVVIFTSSNKPIDESYFVSDGTKYVLTMDSLSSDEMLGEFSPEKTHLIYFYSGDKVTDLKMYYEFENEDVAKKAADYMRENEADEDIKNISVNGKYVIATANESVFQDMTTDDAKQQVELLEMIQNINMDDTTEE